MQPQSVALQFWGLFLGVSIEFYRINSVYFSLQQRRSQRRKGNLTLSSDTEVRSPKDSSDPSSSGFLYFCPYKQMATMPLYGENNRTLGANLVVQAGPTSTSLLGGLAFADHDLSEEEMAGLYFTRSLCWSSRWQ